MHSVVRTQRKRSELCKLQLLIEPSEHLDSVIALEDSGFRATVSSSNLILHVLHTLRLTQIPRQGHVRKTKRDKQEGARGIRKKEKMKAQ